MSKRRVDTSDKFNRTSLLSRAISRDDQVDFASVLKPEVETANVLFLATWKAECGEDLERANREMMFGRVA